MFLIFFCMSPLVEYFRCTEGGFMVNLGVFTNVTFP